MWEISAPNHTQSQLSTAQQTASMLNQEKMIFYWMCPIWCINGVFINIILYEFHFDRFATFILPASKQRRHQIFPLRSQVVQGQCILYRFYCLFFFAGIVSVCLCESTETQWGVSPAACCAVETSQHWGVYVFVTWNINVHSKAEGVLHGENMDEVLKESLKSWTGWRRLMSLSYAALFFFFFAWLEYITHRIRWYFIPYTSSLPACQPQRSRMFSLGLPFRL